MKSNFRRWLPAITRSHTQATLLGVAALAVTGAIVGAAPLVAATTDHVSAAVAGTEPNAAGQAFGASTERAPAKSNEHSDEQDKAAAAKAADKATADKAAAEKAASQTAAAKAAAEQDAANRKAAELEAMPKQKLVPADIQLQPNYFYCGPAATRIALSAKAHAPSQDAVAGMLGTTTSGTDSAVDVTRVLNSQIPGDRYRTVEIPGQRANGHQVAKLRADVMTSVNQGDAVVANIAGTVVDTSGEVHSYEGGHYLTVVGYTDQGYTAVIADPADAVGAPLYTLSVKDLANWIASRGYSSLT